MPVTSLFSVIRLLTLTFVFLLSANALATTTLFEVSDGENRIMLGGTIHLLHPDEYPLPEAFDQAFAEADVLYLEADVEAMQDSAFSFKLLQSMLYPEGTALYDELSPEMWERLERYAKEHHFPLHQFVSYEPAFVSIIMTVMEAQHQGITDGVDEHYYHRARAESKPVGVLETNEDILSYMKAMTKLDPDAMIESALHDLKHFDDMMDITVQAWRSGDLDRLDRDLGQPMRENAPELYQTLLIDRNLYWMETIEPMFKSGQTELVLVGSLHLAGEKNLLQLLEERGYEVTRYESN